MARFYGTVQGQRGEASRLGHSELYVSAESHAGNIRVRMYCGNDGESCVTITAVPREYTTDAPHTLYDGKVADLLTMDRRHAQLQALGMESFIKRFEEQAA